MKIIATLTLLLAGLSALAQNVSLTIFNNNGQQFFVIMNGIRQNSLPQTNVRVGGMTTGSYEIKLIFADGKTGDINKKIYVDQTGDYLARVVFKGKKRKLQYFGMTENGQLPAGGTSIQYRPNDQSVYSDQLSGNANGSMQNGNASGTVNQTGNGMNNVQTGNGTSGQVGMNTNVSVSNPNASQSGTIITGTTITDPNTNNGQIGMNTNVSVSDPNASQSGTISTGTTITDPNMNNGQIGMNTNVSVSDPNASQSGTISTGTTITDPNMNNGQIGMNTNVSVSDPNATQSGTISTGTTITDPNMNNGQVGMNVNVQITDPGMGGNTGNTQNGNGQMGVQINMSGTGMGQGTSATSTTTTSSQTTTINQSTSGQMNTQVNASSGLISGVCNAPLNNPAGFVAKLNEQSFEEDKVQLIRSELKSSCVTSQQAFSIVETLTFPQDRLETSRYLYDRMTDRANATVLFELLTFDTDKEIFRKYMQSH